MVATYVPGPHGPMVFASTAGGAAATTFDPANKNADITLSGGNLIATDTHGSNAWISVRSTAGHSSGKFYCEFTNSNWTATAAIGVCDGSFPFTVGAFLGSDLHSLGWFDSGNVLQNGSTLTAIQAFGGNTTQMAYDASTGNIWFKTNGAGNWNNSGAADPATAAGGIATGLGGTTVFAGVSAFGNLQGWTANFGGSAYAFTAPSGFGNW